MSQRTEFESSPDLKRLFLRELELWRRATHLGLADLSHRCGVSPSYLAHIGRYGRIPSKPVLILLALNFGLQNPRELFESAKLSDEWPFDAPQHLATREPEGSGFLSVKLDMAGFIEAIKGAIRTETRPRTLQVLLNSRPLRIGINLTQPWLFEKAEGGTIDHTRGLVPDLCRMLQTSLQCNIEMIPVTFDRYVDKLCRGEIDLFGPLMVTPHCPSNILFSVPVNRMGLSVLMRTRPTHSLAQLKLPASLDDLIREPYTIAVLRDSRAHLFCATRLKRAEEDIIVCNSDEEATDRVRLKGISRPAHLFLCNSMSAAHRAREYPGELSALFTEPGTVLDMCNNSFAVRPDWPEAVTIVNEALHFILGAGGVAKRIQALIDAGAQGLLEVVPYGTAVDNAHDVASSLKRALSVGG